HTRPTRDWSSDVCSSDLGRGHDGLSGANLVGQFFRPRIPRHEGAGALSQFDDPLVLELAVRLGHGVRVDHKLLRQRANAWQLLSSEERRVGKERGYR